MGRLSRAALATSLALIGLPVALYWSALLIALEVQIVDEQFTRFVLELLNL